MLSADSALPGEHKSVNFSLTFSSRPKFSTCCVPCGCVSQVAKYPPFTFSSVTGSSNKGLVLKLVGTTLTSLSEQKGVQSFLVEFARV